MEAQSSPPALCTGAKGRARLWAAPSALAGVRVSVVTTGPAVCQTPLARSLWSQD